MAHDFSPINSEAKYQAALNYLMTEGMNLGEYVLGERFSPHTPTIFAQTKEEYDFIDHLIRTYGTRSPLTHGVTFYAKVDMIVAGNPVMLLGVRQPDTDRKELGYVDFSVQRYDEIKSAGRQYIQEVTTGRGQSLLELRHPDFDIRGYLVAEGRPGQSHLSSLCR